MGDLKEAILAKRNKIKESNDAEWVYSHLYNFEFNTNLYIGFIYDYKDGTFIFKIANNETLLEESVHLPDEMLIFDTLLCCGKSLKQVVLHPRTQNGSDVTRALKQGYNELVCEMRKYFESELGLE